MSANGPNLATVTTKVSFTATTDIVAAIAAQRVFVYGGMIVASAAVTIDLQDGTSSLAGVMSLIAGTPVYFDPNPDGSPIFKTTAGNAFHAVQVGAGTVSGFFRTAQA